MGSIIIKNGLVFDPINAIEGETKDILVEEGKIVEKFTHKKDIKEIDAKGKTVIPAGIDVHSHVASQQVNWVRLLGSRHKEFQDIWNGLTMNYIAGEYIKNGYTFFLEANVFPSLSKQALFNFVNMPVLDKGMLLNVSNLWTLDLEFQRGLKEEASIFLSDLLAKTKGFGFKVYNPFESESWSFNTLRSGLEAKGRLYNFIPLDIYENLLKFNEHLRLPHSLHAHVEGYEENEGKANLSLILNKVKDIEVDPTHNSTSIHRRTQILHLAHASSYNIDGNNTELIDFLNSNSKVDLDLGFLGFDDINPLVTSDRRLIKNLTESENPYKLFRSAVESEGDGYATLRRIATDNKKFSTIWANAIELALSIKNKWQIQFSLNFPNYSHLNKIPEMAAWLLSEDARKEMIRKFNHDDIKEHNIHDDDNVLSFNEFVIITRASPAKSLGLGDVKGNLGPNADGDINILNIDLNKTDLSKIPAKIITALTDMEYVIKEGKIIKANEKIDMGGKGHIFWSKGKLEKQETALVLRKKEEYYQKYGSMFYQSLRSPVDKKYLREVV